MRISFLYKPLISLFLLILLVTTLTIPVFAETSEWFVQLVSAKGPTNADYDDVYDVAVDPFGGIYVVGSTTGVMEPGYQRTGHLADAYIQKFDENGQKVWTRQFGHWDFDAANAAISDDIGDVIVVGRTYNNSFMRKYDTNGTLLWEKIGDKGFKDLVRDSEGNLYVVGPNIYKYSPDGNLIWKTAIDTINDGGCSTEAGAFEILLDRDGNIYTLSKDHRTLDGNWDSTLPVCGLNLKLRKYDPTGSVIFTQMLGTHGSSIANSISNDRDGNLYYILTESINGVTYNTIKKTTPNNEEIWSYSLPGYSIMKVNVAGQLVISSPNKSVKVLDSSGNLILTKDLASQFKLPATEIVLDRKGNAYLAYDYELSHWPYSSHDVYLKHLNLPFPNQPPEIDPNGPYQVQIGDSIELRATGYDPEDEVMNYSWDLDNDGEFEILGAETTFDSSVVEIPGIYNISVKGIDVGGLSTISHTTVEVLGNNAPPSIQVESSYQVEEFNTGILTATGTDPNGDGIEYSWDLDNDGNFETQGQTVTFSALGLDGPGTQHVVVKGCDPGGLCDTVETDIQILNAPPTARMDCAGICGFNFEGGGQYNWFTEIEDSPADIAAGFQYYTDCTSDGIYEFDHGGYPVGFCGYPDNGIYMITGKIVDKDGGFNIYTQGVRISNRPPNGTLMGPTGDVFENQPAEIRFDKPADPAQADNDAGILFSYDCTNDGIWELEDGRWATSHHCVYPDSGEYTVKGAMKDKDGGTNTQYIQVTVLNGPPSATFSASTTTQMEGGEITYTFTDQTDLSPIDLTQGFLYSYDCDGDYVFEASRITSAIYTCSYADDGLLNAHGIIEDKDGGFSVYSVPITIENVSPTAVLNADKSSALEGGNITLSITDVLDPSAIDQAAGFKYGFDCEGDGVFEESNSSSSTFTCEYADNGVFAARGVVSDKDGGEGAYSIDLQVENVAPIATFASLQSSIAEGDSVELKFSDLYDPSTTDVESGFLYSVDCANDGVFEIFDQPTPTLMCEFRDNGNFTIRGVIEDKDGGESEYYASVSAANLSPSAELNNLTGEINEGESIDITFINQIDPGEADVDAGFTYSLDCSNDGTFEVENSTQIPVSCSYLNNGIFTVLGEIRDKDGGASQATLEVTVDNVAPLIQEIAGPVEPVQVNVDTAFSVQLFDPGVEDIFSITWLWGDGTTTENVQTSQSFNELHQYAEPGVYTVSLMIEDSDGGSSMTDYQYVVVYNPLGGSVSGNGSIISPAGAYSQNPSLSEKATFGFVSKYERGANIPTGKTKFSFKFTDFTFDSTSYEWLVVAGKKAQYKGSGTINGVGDYGFMLTALDGDLSNNKEPDRFRIKIWDKLTGNIIYDNQIGSDDNSDPSTTIEKGNIIIHK